jgi:tryptophan synthase alpha chain
MNLLQQTFAKKKPFIGFLVGGDGGIDYSVDCALNLIEGGVDILEVGFPFSDPVADGPVIQKACERSLELGTNASAILEIARKIRKKSSVPLILFSYFNPLLQQGFSYLKKAKEAGFDAILTIDLPFPIHGEKDPYFEAIKEAGLIPILVLSPSTDSKRLTSLTKKAEGFLYYACQKGTTGARTSLPEDLAFHIQRIRSISSLPIAVGFGIADQKSATKALALSDGFVVGSAFVKEMEAKKPPSALKELARQINPQRP